MSVPCAYTMVKYTNGSTVGLDSTDMAESRDKAGENIGDEFYYVDVSI